MNRFTRPSRWLESLFTPSRVGWKPPSSIADEVNLTQPYDGSGWPIMPIGEWIVVTDPTAAGAAGNINDVVIVGEEEILRVLAVSVRVTAGVLPRVHAFARDSGLGLPAIPITETITVGNLDETEGLPPHCPIVPQGHNLGLNWVGGDGATVLTCRALVCRAPLGSVFYV